MRSPRFPRLLFFLASFSSLAVCVAYLRGTPSAAQGGALIDSQGRRFEARSLPRPSAWEDAEAKLPLLLKSIPSPRSRGVEDQRQRAYRLLSGTVAFLFLALAWARRIL